MRQRLAESFEAALRIAEGRAVGLEMDSAREHLFSSKFACPVCSYSLSELEPRLFSFNSPVGACTSCDGLGQVTVFDADRVVAFPSLSLASGAVKGWDRRNGYTFSLLESVARHYLFDIDAVTNGWRDELFINAPGYNWSFPVGSTVSKGSGGNINRFRNSNTNNNAPNASNAGNVQLGHAGPISTFVITYTNGNQSGGGNQWIGMSDISFQC